MKQRGFTLVEMVLAISIISILFFVSTLVMRESLDAYSHVQTRGSNTQDTRYGMERMVRELLLAGDTPTTRIQSISSNAISFVDSNGNITNFTLSGTNINRGGDTLLQNVTSFTVTGYKDNGNVTTTAADVRRVRIALVTTPLNDPGTLTMTTDIYIRNYLYENFR